jgi:ABC-type glycerol-3-phosphate transport system substrate-binding protein
MPGLVRRLAAALVALALGAAACSQAGTTAGGGPPSTSTSPGVAELLDFTAPALGGGTLRGADYAGKDVAIWFWAPW